MVSNDTDNKTITDNSASTKPTDYVSEDHEPELKDESLLDDTLKGGFETLDISQTDDNNNPNSSSSKNSHNNDTNTSSKTASTTNPSTSSATHTSGIADPGTFINSVVADPQKEQEGQNAYISYSIVTETDSPVFQSNIVRVRRRFSDFHFLYTFLAAEYPACSVPPLPDKNRLEYIKGDRFAPEFTLKRAASLTRFLSRIAEHPILRKSPTFVVFLESNDWHAHKRQVSSKMVAKTMSESPGVLDGISESLLNAFNKVAAPPPSEFVEAKEKMDKLDDNLVQVERSFLRVTRRQGDLATDFTDLSEQLVRLAGLEKALEPQFCSFANGTAFLSRANQTLRDQIDGDYLVFLRDLQNYVMSMKALLKIREQKQLDFEALTYYLQRAEAEKQSIATGSGSKNFLRARLEDVRGIDHEASKHERLRKLDSKINGLEQEVENVKKVTDTFQELAINEFQIFDQIKEKEMKNTLSSLADNHIHFYESLIAEWSALLK